MEHADRPHGLTQQELLRLEDFLKSNACGEGSMSLSRAHGFLTAVVSAPEALEPDEWMRVIFDEPVFDDSDEVKDVLGLIQRLHQSIECSIPRKGGFSPILEFVQRSDGSLAYRAEEWCQGYISAMALWGQPTPGRVAALLEPVFLITRPQSTDERQFRDAHYDELCAMLPRAAEAVYAHWHPGG
ncbi:MAG: YecA family protein [Chromatiales bacterium]|jgi:uncharacterized protein